MQLNTVCRSLLLGASLLAISSGALANASQDITEAETVAAQKAWCGALVSISKEYKANGQKKAAELAQKVLDGAYGYKQGTVLFKPTLTSGDQVFRNTNDGALAYFVGGNPAYPNDKGFALKGWEKCEIRNSGIHLNGNMALTMGNVVMTNDKGDVTTVDKTWAFKKGADGVIRIVLHHSSLPFKP